ncbi:MAG: hypothetical protein EAZ44_06885, partial [Cytophagia bacterium]
KIKNKEQFFIIPDNYFDNLPEKITEKIKNKEQFFITPDNYFDNLPEKITEKIEKENKKVIKKTIFQSKLSLRLMSIASLSAVVLTAWFIFKPYFTDNEQIKNKITFNENEKIKSKEKKSSIIIKEKQENKDEKINEIDNNFVKNNIIDITLKENKQQLIDTKLQNLSSNDVAEYLKNQNITTQEIVELMENNETSTDEIVLALENEEHILSQEIADISEENLNELNQILKK